MFLKNLTINLWGKDIRSVDFHIGVNLIVDRTGKGETVADSGNNVGKTTLLKIVDFCLGASAAIIRDSDAKDLNAENSKFIKELERETLGLLLPFPTSQRAMGERSTFSSEDTYRRKWSEAHLGALMGFHTVVGAS